MTPIEMVSPPLILVACNQPRTLAELEPWADAIKLACQRFEINTIRRVAAFIAQMAHESELKPRIENLNYSVEGLLKTFTRQRISTTDCGKYGRCADHGADQQAIANIIYGGTFGLKYLGNTEPGDGWMFRGGGPLQMTGRDNYTRFAREMGKPLIDTVVWVRNTIEGGVMSAAWFWEENDINRLADTPGVTDETRRINGGVVGLEDRKVRFNRLVDAMLRLQQKEPA